MTLSNHENPSAWGSCTFPKLHGALQPSHCSRAPGTDLFLPSAQHWGSLHGCLWPSVWQWAGTCVQVGPFSLRASERRDQAVCTATLLKTSSVYTQHSKLFRWREILLALLPALHLRESVQHPIIEPSDTTLSLPPGGGDFP